MKTSFARVPDIKSVAVVTVEDLTPYLESNKVLQTLEQTKTDGMMHFARIPNYTLTEWLNEELNRGNHTIRLYSPEFNELVERKLKDPANAHLLVQGPRHRVGWSG